MDLNSYDFIVINSSAGKDSICAIYEVSRLAGLQGYPRERIIISHQDLRSVEWAGTKALAAKQAELFGLEIRYSHRVDKNGYDESLLEYVERRGKWPSSKQRYCTSDFKRDPGAKIIRAQCRKGTVLQVFGFRAEESPDRANKPNSMENKRLTTQSRVVTDWFPIQDWSLSRVWHTIKSNNLPYHRAYDLGMPRLSCVFCIFSPFDALVLAGEHNLELLDEYVAVEKKIGHSFREGLPIASVKQAIENGYKPKKINDWKM